MPPCPVYYSSLPPWKPFTFPLPCPMPGMLPGLLSLAQVSYTPAPLPLGLSSTPAIPWLQQSWWPLPAAPGSKCDTPTHSSSCLPPTTPTTSPVGRSNSSRPTLTQLTSCIPTQLQQVKASPLEPGFSGLHISSPTVPPPPAAHGLAQSPWPLRRRCVATAPFTHRCFRLSFLAWLANHPSIVPPRLPILPGTSFDGLVLLPGVWFGFAIPSGCILSVSVCPHVSCVPCSEQWSVTVASFPQSPVPSSSEFPTPCSNAAQAISTSQKKKNPARCKSILPPFRCTSTAPNMYTPNHVPQLSQHGTLSAVWKVRWGEPGHRGILRTDHRRALCLCEML
eukprot:GGOE01011480.1.p1 GENE.GGOE01011480.1~~GGOE01011480.1.p1  ORF type:complete len:336 (-),score=-32.17 GGOE01011480.1:177-1184(-)